MISNFGFIGLGLSLSPSPSSATTLLDFTVKTRWIPTGELFSSLFFE
jgi:hypothetical protein